MRGLAIGIVLIAIGAPRPAAATRFHLDIDKTVLVEGSASGKGLQPDYLVNPDDPLLRRLFEQGRRIGKKGLGYWGTVRAVRDLMKSAFPRSSYDDPRYHALMKQYREAGRPVPVGEYYGIRAATCREHMLATHLTLQHAGIDNDAVYGEVTYTDIRGPIREDHGLVVLTGKVRDKGGRLKMAKSDAKEITVDSYNGQFDGLPLRELMSDKGATGRTKVAPSAARRTGRRRILRVRSFPTVRPLK